MKKNLLPLSIIFVTSLCQLGFDRSAIDDIEMSVVQEDYKTVRDQAEKYLAENPTRDQRNKLNYYLGLSYVRLGEHAKARSIFQSLLSEGLDSKTQDLAYMGLFDCYYLDEDYIKAHDTIAQLLKLRPKSEYLSVIYLKYARVNLKLAQWEDAHYYLEKILNEFPNSLEARTAQQLLAEKYYFAVQVGSFLDRARAEQLVNELKDKGEYVYIVETLDPKSAKYFRVRVGQLAELEEAQKLRTKLSQKGYPAQIYP
jgi:tetratricopeptide (TPR) repeat protein